MHIVYRLEEPVSLKDNVYKEGDIISAETIHKLIQDGYYEIHVTIIVVQ